MNGRHRRPSSAAAAVVVVVVAVPPPPPTLPPPPCAHDSIRTPPEATPTRWTCTRRIGRRPGHVSNRQRAAPGPRRSFRLAKILRAPRSLPRTRHHTASSLNGTQRRPTRGHVNNVFFFSLFFRFSRLPTGSTCVCVCVGVCVSGLRARVCATVFSVLVNFAVFLFTAVTCVRVATSTRESLGWFLDF